MLLWPEVSVHTGLSLVGCKPLEVKTGPTGGADYAPKVTKGQLLVMTRVGNPVPMVLLAG